MKFDQILSDVGGFGLFEIKLYVLLSLPMAFCGMLTFYTVFVMGEHAHRCKITSIQNDTYAVQNSWHQHIVNKTVPQKIRTGVPTYSECSLYNDTLDGSINYPNVSTNQIACNSWVYDTSEFSQTVISDLNLVCDRTILQTHASMALFSGFLVGGVVFGAIGDIFGRKASLNFAVFLLVSTSFATAWSPNIEVFYILRFLSGVGFLGYWNSAAIIAMETVRASKRVLIVLLYHLVWCTGEGLLALLAYFFSNWRHLQMAFTIPFIFCWTLWCFMPESPRWLISKGDNKAASAIIQGASKKKNVVLSDDVISGDKQHHKHEVLPLFRSPVLLIRWMVMLFNWFAFTLGYYGLTLSVGKLGGNVYINFLVSVIMEAAGYICSILLMDRIGRKLLHCGGLLVAGCGLLLTIFTTLYGDGSVHWITIGLSMCGKLGVSAVFGAAVVYTTEMFPTRIRNFVLGTANVGARVGGMAAPYVADLGVLVETEFGRALPLVVCGVVMVAAGLLSLVLPETKNKALPETVQDANGLR